MSTNLFDPESPFSSYQSSFVLYIEPVLNRFYQTYQNVITVNCLPKGPIADMVIPISTVKLSPFQESGQFSMQNADSCMHILCRYKKGSPNACMKNARYFMTTEDIPSVLGYLTENGYKINTDITKILLKNGLANLSGNETDNNYRGKRKMICMASYST